MTDFVDALLSAGNKAKGFPSTFTTSTDGETGVIETPAMPGEITDFDDILERCGFDPEVFELDGTPRISRWQAQTPDGVEWMTSYKISVRLRRHAADIDDLVAEIHRSVPIVTTTTASSGVLVVAAGDLQIGKADGDGTEGIIRRFKRSIDRAADEARADPPETILLAFLGDCVEGMVSQQGRVVGNSDLGLTDQLRVLRHLVTYAVLELQGLAGELHVATVPGNHDEAYRSPVPAAPTDSFAIDSVRAVDEAFELAGRGEDLTFHYPLESELALEVEVGGHAFLLAHGHQWRKNGGHFEWWRKQAFSYQTGAHAEYLLAGHRHHFEVDSDSHRFFIQVPALESRSDWWRNQSGQVSNPGIVLLRPGLTQPDKIAVV
ncbi:metallophosphoesterase [Brevibacterium album]|uniref:metallophosphoesterase n=1 Tax=Brevibacterium album TaxID=417948 RepID=UPI0004251DC6|nr:metallophosphoesterase [Brevibacterium album]